MTTTLEEEMCEEGIKEVFPDEISDINKCTFCDSYDTLAQLNELHRRCYECNTSYRILNIQRSTE